MALNFGILQPVNIGGQFMAGQKQAQENQLAQQQASIREQEMGMRQQEMGMRQQEATEKTEDRALKLKKAETRNKFLTDLSAKMKEGGHKLDRETLSSMMNFGLQSNETSLVDLATKGLLALDEDERFKTEMGSFAPKPSTAPVATAAPGALGSGTFNPDAPAPVAPVNALAPVAAAPVAAPVNALAAAPTAAPDMAGGYTRSQIEQMLLSPTDRVRKTGVALLAALPKAAAPASVPSSIAEYRLSSTDPEFMRFLEKRSAANRAPGTTVNLPPQEKAFEVGLGKGQADRIITSQVAAQDAAAIIDTVKTGRDIMKSGMITGAGADFLVNLNQGLKTAGIDAGYADASANSQAFTANMAGNVGKLIKQFGAGTGLSDADREFAKDMAGGRISLDAKAINRILDINERAARNVIARHNKDVKGIKTNIPLEVGMPPESKTPAAGGGAPPSAIDYLRANPSMKSAFDAKYGAGAADRALKGQ